MILKIFRNRACDKRFGTCLMGLTFSTPRHIWVPPCARYCDSTPHCVLYKYSSLGIARMRPKMTFFPLSNSDCDPHKTTKRYEILFTVVIKTKCILR